MRPAKLIAAIVGVLMLITSAGLVTAGVFTLAVTDADGWIEVGPVRITSDATALVGDDIDVDLGNAVDDRTWVGFGEVPTRIDIAARNGKTVFVGIAPAHDVDRYLDGTPYDRVDIFQDEDATLSRIHGTGMLAEPTSQGFWVASSTSGTLEWDATDGEWAIVVLNADGSPGVDVAVTGAARIPFVRGIAAVLIVLGVFGLGGGATLTYFGVRRSPTPPATHPATPAEEPVAVA
jgi:hypothetical protein